MKLSKAHNTPIIRRPRPKGCLLLIWMSRRKWLTFIVCLCGCVRDRIYLLGLKCSISFWWVSNLARWGCVSPVGGGGAQVHAKPDAFPCFPPLFSQNISQLRFRSHPPTHHVQICRHGWISERIFFQRISYVISYYTVQRAEPPAVRPPAHWKVCRICR